MPDVQKNFRSIAKHSVCSGQNTIFIVIVPYFWLDLPLAHIVPMYEESCKLHSSFSCNLRTSVLSVLSVLSVSGIGRSWKQNLNCQGSCIWLHKRENSSAGCSQEKEPAVFRPSAGSSRTRVMCIFLPTAKVLRSTGLAPVWNVSYIFWIICMYNNLLQIQWRWG